MPKTLPKVDPDKFDYNNLKPHELRWLQDRGERPPGTEVQPVIFYYPDGTPISNDPYAMNAAADQIAQALMSGDFESHPEVQAAIEDRARELAMKMVREEMHQRTVTAGGREYTGNATTNEPNPGGPVYPPPDHSIAEQERDERRARKAEEAQAAAEGGEDEQEEEPDYTAWKNDQLRAELHTRGLSLDGTKAEMVARLQEDDAQEDSEE